MKAIPGDIYCEGGRHRSRAKHRQPKLPPATQPHVLIEAMESLKLVCGESSIELHKDGKLLIRGNDVVTRAKRTNRIKGGSVAIN